VKANALYRDGSKLSQPLASALVEDDEEAEEVLASGTPHERRSAGREDHRKVIIKNRPLQPRKLPERRKGYTQKASSASQGLSADRRIPGRLLGRSSSTCTRRRRLPRDDDNFAIAVSVGLQYGVRLRNSSKPSPYPVRACGHVQGNDSIKNATSISTTSSANWPSISTDDSRMSSRSARLRRSRRGEEEGKRNFGEVSDQSPRNRSNCSSRSRLPATCASGCRRNWSCCKRHLVRSHGHRRHLDGVHEA